MRMLRIYCFMAVILSITSSAAAGEFDFQLESGGVWFSRNDVRIPGDDGTTFDMLDLTGTGADPFFRFYVTYAFNARHALRLTLAPLTVDGTGRLNEDVAFKDDVFPADVPTKGTYRFNTYRLTYRWTFYDRERWCLGVGGAALVRDAEISLEQGTRKQSRDDLGVVPLLHLYGEYRFNDHASVILDVEGSWSPMGRAVDAVLKAQYAFDSGWYVAAGYRTLEGGADNDDVYTFSWLHYASVVTGYRF